MAVTIKLQNQAGEIIGTFPAQDFKTIAQLAAENNVDIPISCGMGACFVCNCKIKTGAEYIQIDKLMPPAVLPTQDAAGNFTEFFPCVGGIKTEYIKDDLQHEVIIEKSL